VTDPSGQIIGFTGTTGIQYYEGQTGYTYQAQPVIGISGEASSLLSSPDGTGLYWNGNLIATGTGPAGLGPTGPQGIQGPAAFTTSIFGIGAIPAAGEFLYSVAEEDYLFSSETPGLSEWMTWLGTICNPTAFVTIQDLVTGASNTVETAAPYQVGVGSEWTMNLSAPVTPVQTVGNNCIIYLAGVSPIGPTGSAASASQWATFKAVTTIDASSNQLINLAPGTTGTNAVNYNQLTFKDTTEFWVSAQGSNSNNGSFLAPFQTIQYAITQAELISSVTSICNINIASGNYTENLTFNKGYVTLTGVLQSQTQNESAEITGNITIGVSGADDTFNRQVSFQGLNLTFGSTQSMVDTSTAAHSVSLQDCKCFCNSVFFNSTTTASNMRFYLTNVEINQSNAAFTGAIITTNVGLVEFERVDLALTGNATGIVIGGTSVLNRFSLSTIEATNAAAIMRPMLQISSSTTSTHSLGNVAFAYSGVSVKTNSDAIFINSSINTAIIMLNCVFTLLGTASSTNFCVGYNGTGSPTIVGNNNTSLSVNVTLPQTVSVETGITQIQYTNIDPPGLASYSSTADQAIAVAGTPQALTYNTTLFNQGTTLVASSRIYVSAQGNYQLNYTIQLLNGAGSNHDVTTFLKKNGTTIANTGSEVSLGSNDDLFISKTNIVSLNIGDYVEVFFNATSTSVSANAIAAAGALPAIPSVVFNLTQIR
jgi:hypothetical protein